MNDDFTNMFNENFINNYFILALIYIAIMPCIFEELFFRNIILYGFIQNYSTRKSILISALLFGLIHLNPSQIIYAFILGIFLAWIFIKTKSILLCMYLHFLNNLIFLLSVKLKYLFPIQGLNNNYIDPIIFQPLWLDILGLIIASSGFILIHYFSNKSNNI